MDIKHMRINCAICKKPVDRFVVTHEEMERVTRIKAFCHGEDETMQVHDSDIYGMTQDQINRLFSSIGYAFSGARIPVNHAEAQAFLLNENRRLK